LQHDTALISTVVIGLVLAFCGGFIARKLKLPPIVGYLVAGIAVGPYSPGFVGDENLAAQLAEIGVILLMFGVGLHFSISDLVSVRRIALPGAVGQIAVATGIGTAVALTWDWSVGAGLVFGLALSVASTVVLLRALEERNALDSINGRIAVGWLIVEDLAMVLALVILPPISGATTEGTDSSWINVVTALTLTMGKVVIFIALVFLVGTRAVPWLLEKVARVGPRELFTLSVLAVALGVAYGSAEIFGVSFALGAFFAGVVLSESDFSYQAAADSLPLRDAFAVLFFVSVGMLFDPSVLLREPFAVLATLLIIILGKSLAAFAIVLSAGYPARTALLVSGSLAQIGEFSFILAGLGVSLDLLPPEGRDLILAGALLSIALNPLFFYLLDRVAGWLQERPALLGRLERKRGRISSLPDMPTDVGWRNHAVIVGYGRVGGLIGKILKSKGLPFVVIEVDRRRVEGLRKENVAAVFGDATAAGVLEAAHIEAARVLLIAIPQGLQVRRILELARALNPDIDTAIRTHSAMEVAHLERQGVGVAIMGERELALSLAHYALHSLGITHEEALSVVQEMRMTGDAGAFERRTAKLE
jgi:monovalent cation:H+ antiporter-2, CPA2 family